MDEPIIKMSVSSHRKFFYIIRSYKERQKIINETTFYKSIYSGVELYKILEAVINKYIKKKIHKMMFIEPDKQRIEDHIKERNEYIECLYFS